MILNKKEENTVSNIWSVQENLIHFYKMVSLGCGLATLVILVFTVMAYFRNPIVVVRTGSAQEFYATSRAGVSLGKADVEAFIRDYMNALYTWDSFDPVKLDHEIRPFSEDGLVSKVLETQIKKFGKLKDKKLSQDITFLKINVSDNGVSCSFVRVLRVEGIPIVIPTELSFALIQGSRTKVNPMGVYIAGITESERAK